MTTNITVITITGQQAKMDSVNIREYTDRLSLLFTITMPGTSPIEANLPPPRAFLPEEPGLLIAKVMSEFTEPAVKLKFVLPCASQSEQTLLRIWVITAGEVNVEIFNARKSAEKCLSQLHVSTINE